MQTQVGIVGAGPAGLALALLLAGEGIDAVVLEARDRDHVERRVRAGLLEQNTVDLLRAIGAGERLDREGLVHHGISLRRPGSTIHVPMTELTGRSITIYGQQEVVKDLIACWLQRGGALRFRVSDVELLGLDSGRPAIAFTTDEGRRERLHCEIIAGCDGFHGVSRAAIPDGALALREHVYPFCWLGILADAAPATEELIYAWHPQGFALYSMRSPRVSRLYLQVGADERLEDWPDERVWAELQTRLAAEGGRVNEGPVIERGITPMRSFVAEPMQYGPLYLAGDAAHIVPPTGAKGLNLAVNDARLLAAALAGFFANGRSDLLDAYSTVAVRRVWRAMDFSNYMTQMLHRLSASDFEAELQRARLDYVGRSRAAATSLAENYAGLPATAEF